MFKKQCRWCKIRTTLWQGLNDTLLFGSRQQRQNSEWIMFVCKVFYWFRAFKMPNKCGVVKCNDNYNKEHKWGVLRLMCVYLVKTLLLIQKFFICEKHWGLTLLWFAWWIYVTHDPSQCVQCACFMSAYSETCTSRCKSWRLTTEIFSSKGCDCFL